MKLIAQQTTTLQGQATIPSSKSQSIRALLFALLAKGESVITNLLMSDDLQDALQVCQSLGAEMTTDADQLTVCSQGLPLQTDIQQLYTGNSGITTRFIMPLLGFRENTQAWIGVDCGEQMRARPIQSLIKALIDLGLHIDYAQKEGVLPINIKGSLQGGETQVDGITSQYLSALLIALPCAPQNSIIHVKDLHERPYIETTLHWLKQQKIKYQHQCLNDMDIYYIQGKQTYQSFHATIGGDFSSASYLIAAASLIPGCVTLHGLDMQEPQGDKRLVSILQEMGADIVVGPHALVIRGGQPLKGVSIDANDIPDLLPTLAVIGTQAAGKTEIYNVEQARLKETDRIHSMTQGLLHLGARVEEQDDAMVVYQSSLRGTQVDGYDDHRTVMALSIAGLLAEGQTVITDGHAINKTFPSFIDKMQAIGANITNE